MKIDNISIKNEGYVYCKSKFYMVQDVLSKNTSYTFSKGVNKMAGDIDSGIWAISYLLSMYKWCSEDFVLFEQPNAIINDKAMSLDEISEFSCYMDESYPLFSPNQSVREHIIQGLRHSKLEISYDDIRKIFCIDSERFQQPLKNTGNEIFKAMAAIGFSYGKEIFCFPWLSVKRFNSYHNNITPLLKTLESLGKVIILPIGSLL